MCEAAAAAAVGDQVEVSGLLAQSRLLIPAPRRLAAQDIEADGIHGDASCLICCSLS